MNYRSLNDLNSTILKQLHLIPRDIDLIVGVPRSGMLPANLLALYLNLPYTDIHSFMNGYISLIDCKPNFPLLLHSILISGLIFYTIEIKSLSNKLSTHLMFQFSCVIWIIKGAAQIEF